MSEQQITVGLIGDPVAHSLSPAIHNAAFAALGLPQRYGLWPTPLLQLPDRIAALRAPGMLGANVTMPHKQTAAPLLDRLEGIAELLGAVNTIVNEGGTLVGLNTDLPALQGELTAAGHDLRSGPAVVLGTGGAALIAAWALAEGGAPLTIVAGRRLDRAEQLLAELLAFRADDPALQALDLADAESMREALGTATLVINATSAGWRGELPIDPMLLHPGLLVYDLVYRRTPLLEHAAQIGARTLDGLGMLVRQAALAWERWTGQQAPLETMRAAALAAQEARP